MAFLELYPIVVAAMLWGSEWHGKMPNTPSARVDPPPLQYSRHQLLHVPPSGLDATAQSTIRQLGIGYRLPKMRTHRAGRRKQNPIRIIDNSRSDNINALPLSTQTTIPKSTATGRSDNHRHTDLISVSLQPDSQSSNAGFRIALFNAKSVGSSEKRAEISTFVSDNGIDLLNLTLKTKFDFDLTSFELIQVLAIPFRLISIMRPYFPCLINTPLPLRVE